MFALFFLVFIFLFWPFLPFCLVNLAAAPHQIQGFPQTKQSRGRSSSRLLSAPFKHQTDAYRQWWCRARETRRQGLKP